MIEKLNWNRTFATALPCVALMLLAAPASADEPTDTVFLADGGRLRGAVTDYNPQKGVVIKLLDGSIRKVKKAQVLRLEYGETAPAPAAAPSPPPAPPASVPTPAPVATPPKVAEEPAPVTKMRSTGLFATGVTLIPVGALAAIGGVVFIGIGKGSKHYADRTYGTAGTTASSGDATPAGIGLLVGGIATAALGTIFVVVGGKRIRVPSSVASAVTPLIGPTSVGLKLQF